MKYIRTPDGRFFKGDNYGFGVGMPYKNYDVKVADTIPELCDEFVCIGSAEYQKYIKHSLKEALQKKEWLERKGYTCNIKGAIFTDEGLIYKAKMKGISPSGEIDWELL